MPHMALAEATPAGALRSSHPCTRLLLGAWFSMWPPGSWAQNIVESRFGVLPRCYLLMERAVSTQEGGMKSFLILKLHGGGVGGIPWRSSG